jgi:hypothetical protein
MSYIMLLAKLNINQGMWFMFYLFFKIFPLFFYILIFCIKAAYQ